ncbi:aspartate-semialdehyde dehydrogenase [Erythrobacter sp. KY5]|uniref:aspartate-semialdehyde dehydrogenase n=1 Tax=Erythrobacter sp. KY5 TaxID=2011159 RepID=UPI000DBF2D70|nr:aspartate-semialdehyde dehydrogenase [Erythrobacter sp. KY5]AWW75014.1 aspartate-semialdehyde dehydrogenase [Erythrobacter sp. KY5]
MRALVIAASSLALAACGDSGVPSPAERLEQRDGGAVAEIIDPGQVTLKSEGLVAGPDAFFFAAGQSEVEAAIARAIGEPGEVMDMPECGAGPMESSTYPGGLTVNYQDGIFVGWLISEPAEKIGVEGLPVGTARAQIEAMPGFAMMEGSTLGEEFMLGDRLAGFIEDDAVSMLYSGTQCFFR